MHIIRVGKIQPAKQLFIMIFKFFLKNMTDMIVKLFSY